VGGAVAVLAFAGLAEIDATVQVQMLGCKVLKAPLPMIGSL
jgi:hypothetical protein